VKPIVRSPRKMWRQSPSSEMQQERGQDEFP
jgi:hypothetical protein